MNAKQLLIKAKARIEDPKNWIQGAFVREIDETGERQYCLVGAMEVGITDLLGVYFKARRRVQHVVGTTPLTVWNDSPERTHADVIQALKEAIFLAGA